MTAHEPQAADDCMVICVVQRPAHWDLVEETDVVNSHPALEAAFKAALERASRQFDRGRRACVRLQIASYAAS